MTEKEVMTELESLGTEQNRKVYSRHCITGNIFGVSFAHQYKLQKRIKVDQKLAEALWATGNHDARVLATLIADPAAIKMSLLDKWVKESDNQLLSFETAALAAKTPFAWKCVDKWTNQPKKEWIAAAGWCVLSAMIRINCEADDDQFTPYLERIEKEIHGSLNRVRYAMNGALISIGGRSDALEKLAVPIAKRIGKVEVDHGDTNCKTPDAVAYIKKATDHRKKKKKPAPKKKAKV